MPDLKKNLTAKEMPPKKRAAPKKKAEPKKNIVADPKLIMDKKDKVKAIVVSHAHLDHVGAVQYMAQLFPQAPIYGTPFTIEVLKVLMKSQRSVSEPLKNKFIKNTAKKTT